jgi:hypothetical protein
MTRREKGQKGGNRDKKVVKGDAKVVLSDNKVA